MAEHEIHERLRSGAWQSVHNGVLHDLGHTDERWRLHAALLTQASTGGWPDGVALSHATAAGLYGYEGVPADPLVHLVVPRDWIPSTARTRCGCTDVIPPRITSPTDMACLLRVPSGRRWR